MMLFRKKPVVIEACHWVGDEGWGKLPEWLDRALNKPWGEAGAARIVLPSTSDAAFLKERPVMEICTLEGVMTALLGDYILQGVKGELYPCKPDVLALTYERVNAVPVLSQAAADVLAERRRQVEAEGWTPEHDDCHRRYELGHAADAYEFFADNYPWVGNTQRRVPSRWPATWDLSWFKPKDRRRDYVRAHALRQAEIDRLNRLNAHLLEKIERLDRAGGEG